jgi:RNA polymerase sigma-70 factor (ECF subfamily)
MMDLEPLLRAARDGHPKAWDTLMPPLGAKLRRYFSRWFDPEDAEDLTQITMLAIIEALPNFEPKKSLQGWVFGIARNQAHDALHDQYRVRALCDAVERLPVAPEPSLSSELARVELRGIAVEEVQQLPEHLRAVIENDLDSGDAQTFAEQQGIARATVRTRRYRAHDELRERIDDRCQTPPPAGGTRTPTP